MYELVLGRRVDASGMLSCMHGMRHGMSLATLITNALNSEEFASQPRPLPHDASDIDKMFYAAFGRPPPVLDAATCALPVPEYTEQLLTAVEQRELTCFTAAMYGELLDPNDSTACQFWIEDYYGPDRVAKSAIQAAAASLPPRIAVSLILLGKEAQRRDLNQTLESGTGSAL